MRALGIKLAVVSVCSFACKAVLVALEFFGAMDGGSSVFFSLSTLLVEALPSLLTIVMLIRYHSGSMNASRGNNIGVALLTRESDHTCKDAAVIRESRDIDSISGSKSKPAIFTQDHEAWLAQFMANGRVLGISGSKSKPANFTQDHEAWLAQFMANGRVLGAAAFAPAGIERTAAQVGSASGGGV